MALFKNSFSAVRKITPFCQIKQAVSPKTVRQLIDATEAALLLWERPLRYTGRCVLELCVAGGAGEGYDIADVGHAGHKKHQTLKSESES